MLAVHCVHDTQCPVRLVTQSDNHLTARICIDINAASGLWFLAAKTMEVDVCWIQHRMPQHAHSMTVMICT